MYSSGLFIIYLSSSPRSLLPSFFYASMCNKSHLESPSACISGALGIMVMDLAVAIYRVLREMLGQKVAAASSDSSFSLAACSLAKF